MRKSKQWIKSFKAKDGKWVLPVCPATGKEVWVETGILSHKIMCKDGNAGPCAYLGGITYRSPEKISLPCHYPVVNFEGDWTPRKSQMTDNRQQKTESAKSAELQRLRCSLMTDLSGTD